MADVADAVVRVYLIVGEIGLRWRTSRYDGRANNDEDRRGGEMRAATHSARPKTRQRGSRPSGAGQGRAGQAA